MPDKDFRWKAVATYRQTHDKKTVLTEFFEEISDLDDWIEAGPSFEALDTLVVTYNLTGPNLTLAEIEGEEYELKEDTADAPETN